MYNQLTPSSSIEIPLLNTWLLQEPLHSYVIKFLFAPSIPRYLTNIIFIFHRSPKYRNSGPKWPIKLFLTPFKDPFSSSSVARIGHGGIERDAEQHRGGANVRCKLLRRDIRRHGGSGARASAGRQNPLDLRHLFVLHDSRLLNRRFRGRFTLEVTNHCIYGAAPRAVVERNKTTTGGAA